TLASRSLDKPWAEPLILSDDIQAFVIVHPPGTPNDTHYHEHDEWWVVMRGEINWHIEGEAEPIRARAGDFMLCPKFHNHHIEPVRSEEHTSELQSLTNLVCRLLLEKKKTKQTTIRATNKN